MGGEQAAIRSNEEIEAELAIIRSYKTATLLNAPGECLRLLGDVAPLLAEVTRLRTKIGRVEVLFAGGPDTSCRTVWDDGIECVSVPLGDLAAALAEPSPVVASVGEDPSE